MSDPWQNLRRFTQARIGLARAGHAVSTAELLKFQRAHAQARDAVWSTWDVAQFANELRSDGTAVAQARSKVTDRARFLRRPDLGRQVSEFSSPQTCDLSFIVSDGLSARAITTHFQPLWKTFAPLLRARGFAPSPLVLIPFARVAIADEIGQRQESKLAVIFIGERPGLSSPDSLGIYLTYAPTRGKTDAERNCISNVHPPTGLSYEQAADKLIYLISESLRLQMSGVGLKDLSPVIAGDRDATYIP